MLSKNEASLAAHRNQFKLRVNFLLNFMFLCFLVKNSDLYLNIIETKLNFET